MLPDVACFFVWGHWRLWKDEHAFLDWIKLPKKCENIVFQRTKFYKGLIKPIDCEVMKWGSKASPLFDMSSGFCKPPKKVPKKSLLDFVYGKVPSMYSN